tara:strand:+ start:24680 stop:24868 length:189 start_codon:yes stop_codon:yes gene_type:complete
MFDNVTKPLEIVAFLFGGLKKKLYLYRVKQLKPYIMKTITIVKIALTVAVVGSIVIFTLNSI